MLGLLSIIDVANNFWLGVGEMWPYHEAVFMMATGWVLYLFSWWIPSIAFAVIDHYDLLPSFKIQVDADGNGKWPSYQMVKKALLQNIFAHNVAHPALWYGFYLWRFQGKVFEPLPSFWNFIGTFLFAWLFTDATFYWLHRLSHHRSVYKYVHKQHHEFKQPVGLASTYAHPVEEVFVNGVSTFGWMLFVQPHLLTFCVFVLTRYYEAVEGHCGYVLPFSPWSLLRDNSQHDYHHSHNIGVYGIFPFWDWLCGTDKHYKDWLAKEEKLQKKLKLQ